MKAGLLLFSLFLALTTASQSDEQDAKQAYERSIQEYAEGKVEMAMADYQRAPKSDPGVARDPKSVTEFILRGLIRQNEGNLAGSLSDFDSAIKLDPKFARAYLNRGNVKTSLGDLDGAMADYNRALELDPKNAKGYNIRGNAKAGKGHVDAAIADFNRALELDPKNANARKFRKLTEECAKERKGE